MAESIADRFILVMAKIKTIDPDNDNPKRHDMRRLRQHAERILDDAIRQAWEAADTAQCLGDRDG